RPRALPSLPTRRSSDLFTSFNLIYAQNIDRRPPTLLRQFTLQQSQPCLFTRPPTYLYLLPNPDPSLLTLVTSTPLLTFSLSPLADRKSTRLNSSHVKTS